MERKESAEGEGRDEEGKESTEEELSKEEESIYQIKEVEFNDDDKDKLVTEISYNDENPLKLIQMKALELADLTYDRAFAIDESVIRTKVTEYHIVVLCEKFYTKVYADPDEWFSMYFTSDIEDASVNLGDFLMQRIGLDPNYSMRCGFPNIAHKHEMFEMSERTVQRWLTHMAEALEDMADEIIEKWRIELFDYLKYMCYYLMVTQQTQKKLEGLGPYF
jgi:truncated hemoglobin YjbI